MTRSLEDELKRASRSIDRAARAAIRTGRSTRVKSYSVVPVQSARSMPLRAGIRPSDANMLRAYGESPWLHIKIVRLASALASLPLKVVAVNPSDGEDKELPHGHPLWMLLRKPNPMLTGWHLRFLTEVYARTVGGCYWRVKGNALGVTGQIWLYPQNWVRPMFDQNRNVSEYEVVATMPGGTTTERVPAKQMFWFQIPDPLEPYSKSLGDALSLATEIDTFELASESDRKFFENDATPDGALVVPGRMEQGEVDRMKDEWQRKQGGPDNKGQVPVLFGGMDWKTFRSGRREMDFVEGQRFLRDEIIAGVHKHVLGISEDVNFASAKAADYQVGKWELLPRVQWWEDNLEIIAHTFDERLAVRMENPVPQDEQLELQKANEGLARGAITRNEWRKVNKFEPIDSEMGDVFLIQPGYAEVPADGGEPRVYLDPAVPTDGQSPVDGGEGGDPDKGVRRKRVGIPKPRHTPGGHEHDQQSHAGGGGGGSSGDVGERSAAVKRVAEGMGFEGEVEYRDADNKFHIGDSEYTTAGMYSHTVDQSEGSATVKGKIIIFDEAFQGLGETAMQDVMAHEVEHHKWRSTFVAYKEEKRALLDATRRAEEAGVPPKDLPMRADGTINPNYADEFPVYADLYELIGTDTDSMMREDGVTDYSAAYWNHFKRGNSLPDGIYTAVNETLAEIHRVVNRYPDQAKSIQRQTPRFWKMYTKVNKWHDVMRGVA